MTLFVSLDPLIPGCGWQIAAPYHEPIEAGIRLEQERLRGSQWLVARRIADRWYTDLSHEISLDLGFSSEAEAIGRADAYRRESLEELRRERADWEIATTAPDWPADDDIGGRAIFRTEAIVLSHGSGGWRHTHGCQLDVAVFPINPETPIDADLVKAMGSADALQRYFEKTSAASQNAS